MTLFVFMVILVINVSGQKVAVVLSGGGAKGVVHIGFLKALEENDIPIDYITGTSMGAVIGGLYACGYSPLQIEELITSDEFIRWSNRIKNDSYLNFYKNYQPNSSWISIPFTYEKKIKSKLPTNIVSPYEMDFAFMELFAASSAVADYNFDSLLIPFRCVAADIDSNKTMILRKGQLGKAIRASMTFPFYFKPIKINGKLLFDGGMYNNFPVDVAREDFKPDVIIGCKAASNYDPPDMDDIISQIQNMLMENTNYNIPKEEGVVIEPELGSINIIDFSHTEVFIDSGYIATQKKMKQIKKLIKKRYSKSYRHRKRMEFNANEPPLIVDSIKIAGLKPSQKEYVEGILKHSEKYISIGKLKNEYFKLVSDNMIGDVYPEMKYNFNTGLFDLNLDIEKADDFEVEFGGNVSSNAINEAFLGLRYKYFGKKATNLYVNACFGRFYNSVNLSGRIDYSRMIPYYLSAQFTYNNKDYFKNTTYFFQDKEPSYMIRNENFFSFEAGFPTSNAGKFAIGFYAGNINDNYYQTNEFTRLDIADFTSFNTFTPFLFYELNSLNRKQYASSGTRILVSLKYFIGKEYNEPGTTSSKARIENYEEKHDFIHIDFIYDNYFASIKKMKFGFYSEIHLSNQGFFHNYVSSILVAKPFQPIPESKTLFLPNYRAYNYFALGLKDIISFSNSIDLRIEGYYFQPFRQIDENDFNNSPYYRKSFSNKSFILSTSIIYHSPLGPISLDLNFYDRTRDSFSFLINFGYIIFNKSMFD